MENSASAATNGRRPSGQLDCRRGPVKPPLGLQRSSARAVAALGNSRQHLFVQAFATIGCYQPLTSEPLQMPESDPHDEERATKAAAAEYIAVQMSRLARMANAN